MKKFLICITVVIMCIGMFFAVACSSADKDNTTGGSQEEIINPADSDSEEKNDSSGSGNSGETSSDSGNGGESSSGGEDDNSSSKGDKDFGNRGENELPRVPLN